MITILFLICGLIVLAGGIYYLLKEKQDKESRKIYAITVLVGALIVIGTIIKIVATGI